MTLYVGSVAPVALRLIVDRQPGATHDFLNVIGASIGVRIPRVKITDTYETSIWTPSVELHTEKLVHLIYPFAEGDLPRAGLFRLSCDLVFPDGLVPCLVVDLPVVER